MVTTASSSTRSHESSCSCDCASGRPVALIIDDAPMVTRLLAAMLARLGWRCEKLTDPTEAFTTLARARFDLILADHGMPGLTGSELAAKLHERGDGPPLVLVTGRELSEAESEAPGVLAVIHKPFALADLERVTALALECRR